MDGFDETLEKWKKECQEEERRARGKGGEGGDGLVWPGGRELERVEWQFKSKRISLLLKKSWR